MSSQSEHSGSKRHRHVLGLVAALALLAAACGGSAEAFPNQNISLINPFSPGSASDVQGRTIEGPMGEALGVEVVSENVTGGGGSVAFSQVAQAEPDGYELLFSSASIHTTAHTDRMPHDYTDFEWICVTGQETATLTVSADSQWQDLPELVEWAEDNPGELTIGNSGIGSFTHLTATAFEDAAGIEVSHVPFGDEPAMQSVLSGDIDASVQHPPEILEQERAGELRVLATSNEEQYDLESLEDFPTMREQGVDVAFDQWRGVGVPAGTPDEVVQQLADACRHAVEEDETWQETAPEYGTQVPLPFIGPEEAEEYIAETDEVIADIIERTGFGEEQDS